MTDPQSIHRPRRWDVPFSREFADASRRRETSDDEVSQLLSMDPFVSMDPGRFPEDLSLRDILRYDTRLLNFRQGDLIVRQGEYGNSAFLVLAGAVRFVEQLQPELLGRRPRRRSRIRSLLGLTTTDDVPEGRDPKRYDEIRSGSRDGSAESSTPPPPDRTNLLEAAPDLFAGALAESLQESGTFGELAALGRIPRAVSVVAYTDAQLLEIRWQGLRDLREYDDRIREVTDAEYREKGLRATLRASDICSEENLALIQAVAEFETYGVFEWQASYQRQRLGRTDPLHDEPIIAEEGDDARSLILIRSGFARRSRRHGAGERTFDYLGRGDVFGLGELIHNAESDDKIPLQSTLRAVGYVDVVRIRERAFVEFILPGLGPEQRPALLPKETALEVRDDEIEPDVMEFLVENRYTNGTRTMLIDLNRCTRCDDCVRACASGHDGDPRFVRHGRIVDHYMVANACMHCADPVCTIGCPTGAIQRDSESGEIVINDLTCIGCSICANSCPYDNIRIVEVRDQRDGAILIGSERGKAIQKATKCDLCIDHHGGPACARACPHDALARLDMSDRETLAAWLRR